MADFDTAPKRYSAFGSGLDWMRVRPEPDGTIDTPDRLHFLPLFRNIAASAPPAGGDEFGRRMRAARAKWHSFDLLFKRGA